MITPPPHRPLHRNGAVALGLAVVIALVLTPWLLHVGVVPRPSPLTRDLPSSFAAAGKAFDARIKARFPPGTPQTRLVAELRRQGFHSGPGLGAEDEMVREHNTLVCAIAARVYWIPNDHGQVWRIRGVYREEGCL